MEKERQKIKTSNPETIIDRKYIDSSEYRRKFDDISENPKLNRILYNLARKMLEHRNGTWYEDMYWIDPISLKVVAQELSSQTKQKIIYSKKTKKVVKSTPNLITIHSHPSGCPPSIEDFNANNQYKYFFGIVCGHNGRVYVYNAKGTVNPITFQLNVMKYRDAGYEENDAQLLALQKMSKSYKITIKEV